MRRQPSLPSLPLTELELGVLRHRYRRRGAQVRTIARKFEITEDEVRAIEDRARDVFSHMRSVLGDPEGRRMAVAAWPEHLRDSEGSRCDHSLWAISKLEQLALKGNWWEFDATTQRGWDFAFHTIQKVDCDSVPWSWVEYSELLLYRITDRRHAAKAMPDGQPPRFTVIVGGLS